MAIHAVGAEILKTKREPGRIVPLLKKIATETAFDRRDIPRTSEGAGVFQPEKFLTTILNEASE